MLWLFQFAATPFPAQTTSGSFADSSFFWLAIIGAIFLLLLGVAFVVRAVLRLRTRLTKSFNRVVLQITVPKERKSEGQGGQAGQEDRLEHIREEIGITETFFSALAGLRAQRGILKWFRGRVDDFSFEIVSHNNLIYFYVDTPKKLRQLIEQQIHAQYPHAQIEEMIDYNMFTEKSSIIGAYLEPARPPVLPFKTYKDIDSDPLSAILNVLSKMPEGNSAAAVQYVVRSAPKKWRRRGVRIVRETQKGRKFEQVVAEGFFGVLSRHFWDTIGDLTKSKESRERERQEKKDYKPSSMEEDMLKGIEEKLSKGGLDVTVRLLCASDNDVLAKQHLDNLINAFSQYNLYRYGNNFQAAIPRNQTKLIQDFIYRAFNERRHLVLNTEEIASLWHLPLHSTEAPNIKWMTGRRSAPPSNIPKQGLLLGHIQYRGSDTKVFMNEADRRRHLYVIGKSGTGKSVFLTNLAIQDVRAGHGVCVVDPHGDLVEDILAHVPKERAEDVIIFDPSDLARPIGLNMLEAQSADQKDFAVQEMIAIFYKLFPPEMIGPMFEHNMRNVMLTLMADLDNPGTVIDIPRMFTDDDYVKIYLKKLKDPVVRAFWEKEMAKTSDFHKSEMLGYLISKVGRFVGNEMMRNIMGQQKSGFNFREAMDQNKILLVNLAKGKTGEVNSKLLGLIVVAKLQMAAMGRADLAQEDRKDFYLYIDEFQNFITDSISTILSEARKYRLNLIVAHQYLGQLADDKGRTDVRDAVLGNAGTICIGRIGPDDAELLAKEVAPTFGSFDLLNPPPFSYYTKLLVDGKATRPFNMASYPPQEGNKQLASALKQLSRLKYGRDKTIVEAEILDRTKLDKIDAGGDMAEASL